MGEEVRGKVTEQLAGGELIISFEGDLLRVANESRKAFKVGEFVVLEVMALSPIRFKLATQVVRRRVPGHFDVSV